MLKRLIYTFFCAAVLLLAAPGMAQAQIMPDYTGYYLDPGPETPGDTIAYMNSLPMETGPQVYAPMIGFLAGALHSQPELYEKVIRDTELAGHAAVMVSRSLWLAGRTAELDDFNAKYDISAEETTAFHAAYPGTLAKLDTVATSSDIDMLWGAYYGSGDLGYVKKVMRLFMALLNDAELQADDILMVSSAGLLNTQDSRQQLYDTLMEYDEMRIAELSLGGIALRGLGKHAANDDGVGAYLSAFSAATENDDAQRLLNRTLYDHKYAGHRVTHAEKDGLGGFLFTTDRRDFAVNTNYNISQGKSAKPDIRKVFHRGDTVYLPMFVRFDSQAAPDLNIELTITTPGGDAHNVSDVMRRTAPQGESAVESHTMTVTTGTQDAPGIYLVEVVLSQQGRSLTLASSYLLEKEEKTQ